MPVRARPKENPFPTKSTFPPPSSFPKPSPYHSTEANLPSPLHSIATSKPFLFAIGPSKREFTIHSALIAAQSPALDRLINSDFSEAQSCHVDLDTVDEGTFLRFVQYAYTGEYDDSVVAEHQPDASPDDGSGSTSGLGEPQEEEAIKDEVDTPAPESPVNWYDLKPKKKKKVTVPKVVIFQSLGEKFASKTAGLNGAGDVSPQCEITPLRTELIPNLYLSHAKVFVFADYWGITRLRGLALQKLGKALGEVNVMKSKKKAEIVELVEYCFEDVRPEELVSLVLLYAGYKLRQLWGSERFREVFGRYGELAAGLVGVIVDAGY